MVGRTGEGRGVSKAEGEERDVASICIDGAGDGFEIAYVGGRRGSRDFRLKGLRELVGFPFRFGIRVGGCHFRRRRRLRESMKKMAIRRTASSAPKHPNDMPIMLLGVSRVGALWDADEDRAGSAPDAEFVLRLVVVDCLGDIEDKEFRDVDDTGDDDCRGNPWPVQ